MSRAGEDAVEERATIRAFMASDHRATYGVGRVMAYCAAPQYLIEREDGSTFWWRADLTEPAR